MLRFGIVGMRGSMVIRLRPCMIISTPAPPPCACIACERYPYPPPTTSTTVLFFFIRVLLMSTSLSSSPETCMCCDTVLCHVPHVVPLFPLATGPAAFGEREQQFCSDGFVCDRPSQTRAVSGGGAVAATPHKMPRRAVDGVGGELVACGRRVVFRCVDICSPGFY